MVESLAKEMNSTLVEIVRRMGNEFTSVFDSEDFPAFAQEVCSMHRCSIEHFCRYVSAYAQLEGNSDALKQHANVHEWSSDYKNALVNFAQWHTEYTQLEYPRPRFQSIKLLSAEFQTTIAGVTNALTSLIDGPASKIYTEHVDNFLGACVKDIESNIITISVVHANVLSQAADSELTNPH